MIIREFGRTAALSCAVFVALAFGLAMVSDGALADSSSGAGASKPLDLHVPDNTAAAKPQEDPTTEVDRLESQRTAVESNKKSSVSLSVSGWVSQQVMKTSK